MKLEARAVGNSSWFKRSTGKKRPVTREIIIIIIIIIIPIITIIIISTDYHKVQAT